MSASSQPVCSGLWRWLQGTGLERFELEQSAAGWIFRGTILSLATSAAEARYEILCDHLFLTRSARISVRDAGGDRALEIRADHGRWLVNGQENVSVKGALDIDLGWSPSTNTLPIRRLGLQPGQSSGEFIAAWVRFPGLTVEPLPQKYDCISARQYRYSSRGGAFTAGLQVDDNGIVVHYEGFWEQVPGKK